MSSGTEKRRLSSPEDLFRQYQLPAGWAEPATFTETVRINGVQIFVAGFSSQNETGDPIFGSAASLSENPIDRAYFELLERASVVSMLHDGQRHWDVRDERGIQTGTLRSSELALVSPDPGQWRYARSNGVAVGQSWRDACLRALWELAERDRILRSWYGEIDPVRIEMPCEMIPIGLEELYSFEAYSFDEPVALREVHVVAVFGFPKDGDAPLLYGFGARDVRARAMGAAFGECLQRLGFLWGEQIPATQPQFFPTADFHQEWFLWPLTHQHLHGWLAGEHAKIGPVLIESRRGGSRRVFADITPTELRSRVFVAKGIPRGELPLVFGRGHPSVASRLPDALQVHPIA